jgi:hypothetical protein
MGGAKSGLSNAGIVLGGLLLGGIGAAMAGIGAIVHTGFAETMDASKGTAQLAAGIKSTGNAAGVSVKGLNDLASSIQSYSGQTDDSIVASEQLLLTFTNIKNKGPDKIFDQATVATANMAARMGGDASGAALQLGKALQDPVKGMSALQRVGIVFDAGQKKTITSMVKAGDTMGAQKIILAELTKEFGGSAEAAGKSLPGQMAIAKRSFEDLSQTLVEGAAPAISVISDKITTDVIPAMKDFATGFENGTGAGGEFRDVLADTGSKIGTVVGWLKDHNKVVKTAAIAVGVLSTAVLAYNVGVGVASVATKVWTVAQHIATAATWLGTTAVKASFIETLALKGMYLGSAIATGVMTAAQWLLNAALTANPIGLVVVAIGALVGAIVLIATKTTWFQTAWEYMSGALGKAWQWLWNSVLAPVIRFILNGFATITDGIASMLNVLSNIPGFEWAKTAADKMKGAADKARDLAKGIKDIPDKKTIDITARFTSVVANATATAAHNLGARAAFASGTNFAPGGAALVGERGPEIVYLPRGSQVIPNHAIGSAVGGGGIDYDRLASAMSRVRLDLDGRNVAASVDQRLAPR